MNYEFNTPTGSCQEILRVALVIQTERVLLALSSSSKAAHNFASS